MSASNFIQILTGLQDFVINNVESTDNTLKIYGNLKRSEQICPCCGKPINKIHDYRTQIIKDVPAFGKSVNIFLKKRRYRCECGKRFQEKNEFLNRYQRITKRKLIKILEELGSVRSYTEVSKEHDLSVTTIIRYFDMVSYPSPTKLPKALGIDEFKGNSGGEKYHCILTDLETNNVIDVIRTRYEVNLLKYFKPYDRKKVKYVVSDMYKTYSEIFRCYFRNSEYIIDKYHWMRQATWAFESVRKKIQKKFSKHYRIYFKHSRKLLLKHDDKLTKDERNEINVMLDVSAELSSAYYLKELLYRIIKEKDIPKKIQMFKDWIEEAGESESESFRKCAKTYINWFKPITKSFSYKYTNGFTEGCNNKIKVLKRNAYGFRNYKRFRNRILHIFREKALKNGSDTRYAS